MRIAVRTFIVSLCVAGKLDSDEPAIIDLKNKYGAVSDSPDLDLFDLAKLFFENPVHDKTAVGELFRAIMQTGGVELRVQNKLLKVIGSEKELTIERFQYLIRPKSSEIMNFLPPSPPPVRREHSAIGENNSGRPNKRKLFSLIPSTALVIPRECEGPPLEVAICRCARD